MLNSIEVYLTQWFPTGGPQAVFSWAMVPFSILICSNSLSGGVKHLS